MQTWQAIRFECFFYGSSSSRLMESQLFWPDEPNVAPLVLTVIIAIYGRESEWTPGVGDGQGGLACCDSWGRKESDTTERLNWTELNW